MKTIAVFAALLAVAVAFPPQAQKSSEVYLVKELPSNNIGLDNYQYAYELSDGQKREESAQITYGSKPEEATLRVQGSFSYYNPYDGQTYTVTYTADENGFHPEGAHLPKA